MSGYRLEAPAGRRIDRGRPLRFRFNGRALTGYAGDTLASALLAQGVQLVARSFKLHRPRGIFGAGAEDPCGLVAIGEGPQATPNTRATEVALQEGLVARSTNCWPGVGFDLAAINGRLAPWLPAGFYYKTFMWPDWHLFEPAIRRMAGLGHAPAQADTGGQDVVSIATQVLVVGGGPAGVQAAMAAAQAGADVVLAWADVGAAHPAQAALAAAGVQVLPGTTVFGLYDHLLAGAVQMLPPGGPVAQRLWKIRAGCVVLATGAYERPMLFPDNDRPGVMLGAAVGRLAQEYGVACGRQVVLAANADSAYVLAGALQRAGVGVAALVDRRPAALRAADAVAPEGVEVLHDAALVGIRGSAAVRGVQLVQHGGAVRSLPTDLVASCGGWTPNVALFAQAGGGLRWDADAAMFVPHRVPPGLGVVGACAGQFGLAPAQDHASEVGRAAARGPAALAALTLPPVTGAGRMLADNAPAPAGLGRSRGKIFIDLQNDVTRADVALAARENYRAVEHLKRYTTTGMGTDQGKTSNVNALVQMGVQTDRPPEQVGTTRFRPPAKPVTLATLAAGRGGLRLRPLRRMPGHDWHLSRGATMEEFGGWLRPACYPQGREAMAQAALREAAQVRHAVGLTEGSPLGKIEIRGPDAGAFLDWMYVGTMSSLAVGRARYGALLNESGILVDDGIVARLAADRFWVNTSSAGAERIPQAFEDWMQRDLAHLQVTQTVVTSHWAQATVAGPRAWDLLQRAGFPDAIAPQSLPHMAVRDLTLDGVPVRVLRASFSGELGYEINLPASWALPLFERLWVAGQPLDVCAYGGEALQILRIEKGYIHVGTESDGATFPDDVGLAGAVARKASDFVGRRSLRSLAAQDADRMQLVGLVPADRRTPLPVGAHVATRPPPCVPEGYVTSACSSPTLGHPIALARLARGRQRLGERLRLFHRGAWIDAEVCAPAFVDPSGERLHGH
ncbi:MAG: 2Fe-2S iron-sulfur cluster-binding protein [Rhodoferax sp.]